MWGFIEVTTTYLVSSPFSELFQAAINRPVDFMRASPEASGLALMSGTVPDTGIALFLLPPNPYSGVVLIVWVIHKV